MKELDFDELDKAVSSLMGGVPSNLPAETVLSIDTPQPTTPEPVEISAPSVEPMAVVEPTLPPAVKRTGGRFMDVVHPSSDMKPRTSSTGSRLGVTVTPRASVVPPITPVQPEKQTPVDEPLWPDPLDMLDTTTTSSVPKLEEPSDEVAQPLPEAPSSIDTYFGSPFLSDAKVEKRPLGSDVQATAETSVAAQELAPDDEAVTPHEAKAADEPLPQLVPAELSSDLVAIESSEPEEPTSTPLDHRISDHATTPTGPTSISQQYKEQQSTGDQSHTAIYDTAGSEPLAHPAKKKAGWLWIIWVILLLVVGAGGAVALYLLGII